MFTYVARILRVGYDLLVVPARAAGRLSLGGAAVLLLAAALLDSGSAYLRSVATRPDSAIADKAGRSSEMEKRISSEAAEPRVERVIRPAEQGTRVKRLLPGHGHPHENESDEEHAKHSEPRADGSPSSTQAVKQFLVSSRRSLMIATALFALGLAIAVRPATVTGTVEALALASSATALWTVAMTVIGVWRNQRIMEPTLGLTPFLETTRLAAVPMIDLWWALVIAACLAKSWQRSPAVLSAVVVAFTLLGRMFGEHAH